MRPGRRRGGVGQPGGADDAGRHAGAVGQLQPGQPVLAEAAGAVVAIAGGNADGAHVGLHAGGHRGHGAGRVGRLRIGVVGLAQGGVRKDLPAEQVLLARLSFALALQDARRRHRGQAHAVTQEHDDVLRPAGHGAVACRARRAAAVPPLRGLPARTVHRRDFDGDGRRTERGACGRSRASAGQGEGGAQDGGGKAYGGQGHGDGVGWLGRRALPAWRAVNGATTPRASRGGTALCPAHGVMPVTRWRSTAGVASAGRLG